MSELTHLDKDGRASMVDVGHKDTTSREAVAEGSVYMAPTTLAAIRDGAVPKGDVLSSARIAGIMAAKRTPDLIPLCHPLPLTKISVEFEIDEEETRVIIVATVRCQGRTGVEMEALTAVSVAALTIYDMAKALEKTMTIGDIRLLQKKGGKSGDWQRSDSAHRQGKTKRRECTPDSLRRPASGGRLQAGNCRLTRRCHGWRSSRKPPSESARSDLLRRRKRGVRAARHSSAGRR